jgi:hypothetical protein
MIRAYLVGDEEHALNLLYGCRYGGDTLRQFHTDTRRSWR